MRRDLDYFQDRLELELAFGWLESPSISVAAQEEVHHAGFQCRGLPAGPKPPAQCQTCECQHLVRG